MKTIFAATIALLLGSTLAPSAKAQLPGATPKKQTSDPYFSTPAQTASEQSSTWTTPATAHRESNPAKAADQTDIWRSLSRKTAQPVQRIDFSKLKVNPIVKADLLKTAAAWQVPKTKQGAAQKTQKQNKRVTIDFSAPATAAGVAVTNQNATPNTQSPQNGSLKPMPVQPSAPVAQTTQPRVPASKPFAGLAPLNPNPTQANTDRASLDVKLPTQPLAKPLAPPLTTKNLLSPLPVAKQPTKLANAPTAKPLKPIAKTSDFQSTVQQATYQEPGNQAFVPGQNLRRIGNRLKQISGTNAPHSQSGGQSHRIADSSNTFESWQGQPVQGTAQIASPSSGTAGSGYRGPVTRSIGDSMGDLAGNTGETFEPSRVVALVGGEPIFVGDMLFEVNQLLEKYMKGAPQAAKDQQRGNLIKRLLPKYVDQKMLFIASTLQLPDTANIDDVIEQAEKSFNEKALPDIMQNSGVTSTAQFDANLRAQGSSIRQMRRTWAKDQVGRFFLAENVKFSENVTHQELLDEYRSAYDSYANNARCRWEKIEIKFAKAGGRFGAKDKMAEIYQRLVHGGNFQAIAKTESHGFKAFQGGQHDWTNRGSLVSKKIDDAIFSLPQGRLSQIIETKDSFVVVRVKERVDAYHTPFEEVQNKLKSKIIDTRRDEAFKAHLAKLRTEIPVEYPDGQ